jgi:CRP-like cAMP-binding protein
VIDLKGKSPKVSSILELYGDLFQPYTTSMRIDTRTVAFRCLGPMIGDNSLTSPVRTYSDREFILRQGQKNDTLFFILEGAAKVGVDWATVETLHSGAWFGELTFLGVAGQLSSTGMVQSIGPTRVFSVNRSDIWLMSRSSLRFFRYLLLIIRYGAPTYGFSQEYIRSRDSLFQRLTKQLEYLEYDGYLPPLNPKL